ncbi:MAG: glycosyltransferase [Pseudomonadales bacterium]|nr:glycosyltransferase [Pseudomonadales bacterium]
MNQLDSHFDVHFYIFSNNLELEDRLNNSTVHSCKNIFMGIVGFLKVVHSIKPDAILSSIADLNMLIITLRIMFPNKTKIFVREAVAPTAGLNLYRFPLLMRFFYCRLYPHADAIICLSNMMRQDLAENIGIDVKKIVVIPNGVGVKRQLQLPIETVFSRVILAVGRLHKQKGYDQLIHGFARFVERPVGHDYRLVIIGEGSQRPILESLISKYGLDDRIMMNGAIADPTQLYREASFLAMPSRYEGVSNVMIEAMINGLPVLATICHTSAECYINDTNGVLIESCVVDEIVQGLTKMAELVGQFDRNEIAYDARRTLGLDAISEQYVSLIQKVLSGR